eukprot:870337-Rhodomonas_salina.1
MRVLCFLALASVALCFPLDTDSTELIKSESWFSLMSWGKKDKTTICEDLDWRKVSFKKAMELPAAGLFTDLHGTAKWETSGMDVKDDEVWPSPSPELSMFSAVPSSETGNGVRFI